MLFKPCSICLVDLPISEFYIRNETGKPRSECKECNKRQALAWSRKNKVRSREIHLQSEYGIDLVEYGRLSALQNNVCKICEKPERENRKLCVDHCHKTGRVRGLLCGGCNKSIGFMGDSIELLSRAIKYLGDSNESKA